MESPLTYIDLNPHITELPGYGQTDASDLEFPGWPGHGRMRCSDFGGTWARPRWPGHGQACPIWPGIIPLTLNSWARALLAPPV